MPPPPKVLELALLLLVELTGASLNEGPNPTP
jgi:hypothetical protein